MARVQVVAPDGTRGTVDEKDVANLPDGARVLTAQDIAQERLDAEYEKASPLSKVGGVASVALPAPAQVALRGAGLVTLPPELEAYRAGAAKGFTGGLEQLAEKGIAGTVGGAEGAQRYVQRQDELATSSPTATGAGEVAGFVGGMVAGAAGGAAGRAASPIMGGAGAIGAPVEHAVTKALGGLATKGTLGRAATAGAGMAVRGAVEGAAMGGAESAIDSTIHDDPVFGDKLYSAVGHGALVGGSLGAILGVGGSLASSAMRGGASRLSTRARGPLAALEAGTEEAGAVPRGRPLAAIDADAGLREAAPAPKDVFEVGAPRRPVQLRPGGRARVDVGEGPIDITQRLSIDPDAGLYAPRGKVTEPLFAGDLRTEDLFTPAAEQRPVRLAGDAFKIGKEKVPATSRPARSGFELSIDPDAGIAERGPGGKFQGKVPTEDAFRLSSAKDVPREVGLRGAADELGAVEARSPIKLPETPGTPDLPGILKPGGISAALANPSNVAQKMAAEQAWKAVGAGFGLQTTRYAKEAARYFPNGTRDLGEIAMRYGAIDMGEAGASPFASAWSAAKTGTPGDIAPRLAAASDDVGAKIGAITDASGARVPLAELDRGIARVRGEYDKIAGNEHIVNAIDNYATSLRSKLIPGRDGAARLQDVLEQRKGLDDIVYRETKTLDPARRVEALRKVRAAIEGTITDALDEASGKVPGVERAEYQRLKRDYHGLRILTEAAEDSAARSSKHATFGLGEKMAIGSAIASGHIGAAPILAMGGKMIKERGNAAAAAFLSRAAEQGTFDRLVRAFDARVSTAASHVLDEAKPASKMTRSSSFAGRQGAAASRAAAKQEAATRQAQAQQIVKWMGAYKAQPEKMLNQIEEAAAIVSRASGPKAGESYTASTIRAINFIAAHIPIKERRDPLDPRSTPPLTSDEADRLLRATRYALQPETIFADFSQGVITPEGLRAAKTLSAPAFESFQLDLQQHVEDHMLRNARLTQTQRLRIDKLLGYPAGADLKPKAIARLQANLLPTMKAPEGPPPAGPSGAPPLDMKIQQTGFDSIEARRAS